ncbi:putative signal peptidase complex catalytic subunit SEC11 [Annulohypoxylon truncatum]|uniref:putative signal peptidase complex catalytic subunit SEC11 n=1 Tax=Annulohypoxylon truncatum TaxID=327061 RepID=UPI002008BA42|nr:putative signal peptidase complex catalytic subunit SEC11 [Annulohypoxylon truncatum]KAI1208926.1 putative signal peptidase complex catalytic subunit SEC11 [Annulohypoxylon truncatum]
MGVFHVERGFFGRLRLFLASALPFILPISSTFMAWKGLCISTNSPVPIICVISESMAPAFHRGDLLITWNWTPSAEVGDIPVIWFDGHLLPMVHRVIQVYPGESSNGAISLRHTFLTKGDNNELSDVALYPMPRTSVSRKEVVGFVRGYIPFLGWVVIYLRENYWARCIIGLLLISAIFRT